MPKHRPPSRLRYEAEHPTLTARVPTEVRDKLQAALAAEGLNFSEWVQAQVAGHVADAAAMYEKGRSAGYTAGEKAGYRKGRQDGATVGQWGGFVAGLLEARFRERKGQAIDPDGLARHLLKHPEQRAVAEAVLKDRDYGQELARLLRRVGGASA